MFYLKVSGEIYAWEKKWWKIDQFMINIIIFDARGQAKWVLPYLIIIMEINVNKGLNDNLVKGHMIEVILGFLLCKFRCFVKLTICLSAKSQMLIPLAVIFWGES